MKLLITINTGNAAFHPDPERDPDGNAGYTAAEIARSLRKYIKQADEEIGVLECPLIDLNGNTVGRVEIEREGGKLDKIKEAIRALRDSDFHHCPADDDDALPCTCHKFDEVIQALDEIEAAKVEGEV